VIAKLDLFGRTDAAEREFQDLVRKNVNPTVARRMPLPNPFHKKTAPASGSGTEASAG